MGVGAAIAVVVVAAAVTATAKVKQAKKEAKFEKKKLKLAGKQRDLENAREEARIRRAARIQKATILNQTALQGVQFSSTGEGARVGISTRLEGETNFLTESDRLADSADRVTKKQITLNKQTGRITTISDAVGISAQAVASGIK